jgi:hypothetical protein
MHKMSEQLYYTFSTIGSGSTTGERIRAQSPGVGPVYSEPVRSLMRYLTYRLPAGADLRTPVESAPISLVLVRTHYHRLLSHRKYVDREGAGHASNFFTHAIIDPEVVSEQTGAVEPISARAAISLWKSPLWKISENHAPLRSTTIASLTPAEISQHTALPGMLSAQSVQQSYPHCHTERQTAADWLPLVFSAFLMLKKLDKKQLYIAAPAEMVATLIWCITHCLPRTLTIMQDLTFSTYEYEVRSTTTISGTCWLPSTNHSGQFVPQGDLPASYYQPSPGNPVLAINCYNQRQTPFVTDEQVNKFVQFATQSLLQNNMTQLEQLVTQAEQQNYREFEDFLTLFRIQQDTPTKEMIQEILTNPQRWFCLQYTPVQDKLIDLIYNIQDTHWVNWWKTQGSLQIQGIRKLASEQPQSKEAAALRAFADKVMRQLSHDLATNQPGSDGWAMFWDQLLKHISSPSTDLVVWAALPQHLAQLPYTRTYQLWWQKSGQKIAQELCQTVHKNAHPEEDQQLATVLDHWWQQCAEHLRQSWAQQQDTELSFWFDILSTIQPPTQGAQGWQTLLNNLDEALPQESLPTRWCKWETYKTLLVTWHLVLAPQGYLPRRWLSVPWEHLPQLLATADLPDVWKKFALEDRIQLFLPPASPQMLSSVVRCAPLIHEVLARLIQNDQKREQTMTFCEALLQQDYAQRDALLASILPGLFPHEDLTNRIATVARLSAEQLNAYRKDAFYNIITSQQDIPAWLLPRMESYLTNFRVQSLNPDHQQTTWEEYRRTDDILNALLKRNQMLPEQLRPYVSCWCAISNFFSRPVFDPARLRGISNQIRAIELGEVMRQELHQEMLNFLSVRVENEADLTRVIDIFAETLLQSQDDVLPAHVLLLKEMVRLYSKGSQYRHSLPKTIIYIKVVLGETQNLTYLETEQQKREEFTNECLHNLLTSTDTSQVRSIHTTQWPPVIANLWASYLSRRTTANSAGLTKTIPPASSPAQHLPVSPGDTGARPAVLPNPSQGKPLPPQATSHAEPVNDTGKHATPTSGAIKGTFGKKVNKQEDIEDMRNTFYKALYSKRADKIAAAYNEALDGVVSQEFRSIALMSKQVIEDYNTCVAKPTFENKQKFINSYNTVLRSKHGYILLYTDMDKFVRKVIKDLQNE